MFNDNRQAGVDIQVTPEMIEAGMNVFLEFEITEGDYDTWSAAVSAAFKQMRIIQDSAEGSS